MYLYISPSCEFHRILCLILWIFHFAKRLYENRFVHIHGPNHANTAKDLLINCTYYQVFTYLIAGDVTGGNRETCGGFGLGTFGLVLLWAMSQYGNYSAHVVLRNTKLRNKGQKAVPKYDRRMTLSKLFDYVACPNYTYEVMGWVLFAIIAESLAAAVYALLGFVIMASWAVDKNRKYKEEFPREYGPKNRAILPFVI